MLSTVRSPVVLTTLARGQVQERLWGLLLKGKGRFLGRLQTRRGARCPPNLWDSAGIMEGQNLLLQRPSLRKHRADSPRSGESISPDGEPALKLRVSWRWEAEGSQRQVSSSNSRKPKTEDPGSGPGGGGKAPGDSSPQTEGALVLQHWTVTETEATGFWIFAISKEGQTSNGPANCFSFWKGNQRSTPSQALTEISFRQALLTSSPLPLAFRQVK